jgi:16S rRNA U1498 N3-methylase RsmE
VPFGLGDRVMDRRTGILPANGESSTTPAALGELGSRHPAAVRLSAHPRSGPVFAASLPTQGQTMAEIVVAVGPEGGFPPEELDFAATALAAWIALALTQR